MIACNLIMLKRKALPERITRMNSDSKKHTKAMWGELLGHDIDDNFADEIMHNMVRLADFVAEYCEWKEDDNHEEECK